MAILGCNSRSQSSRAFGQEEWLKTRGLAGWLELATDKLEAPARQRIAHEIGAHYAEAVGTHMADGEPDLSAQAVALAELGDPQVAALNFQKSHLTESEAKSIKGMEWTAAKPFFSLWILPLDIMPLAGFVLLYLYPQWIFHSRLVPIAVLMGYAGFRLIPHWLCTRTLPRTSFLRWLMLSNLLGGAARSLILSLFLYARYHDGFMWGFVFLYTFLVPDCFKSCSPLRLWLKLRKMGVGAEFRHGSPPDKIVST